MQINLLFFGITTDLVGATKMKFEIEEGTPVAQFKERLQAAYPSLQNIQTYAIAVNESYAPDDLILNSEDTVAIIPPVSGG